MSMQRDIIPVKKTQSKVLDRLIWEQCQENEKARKLYQQTLHLRNSVLNHNTESKVSHSLYSSQTASSQARRQTKKSLNQVKSQKRSKSKQTKYVPTKPVAPKFHTRASRRHRDRGSTNKSTKHKQQSDKKVNYESSSKIRTNILRNIRHINSKMTRELHDTKLIKKKNSMDKQRPKSAMPHSYINSNSKHTRNNTINNNNLDNNKHTKSRKLTKVVEFNFATNNRARNRFRSDSKQSERSEIIDNKNNKQQRNNRRQNRHQSVSIQKRSNIKNNTSASRSKPKPKTSVRTNVSTDFSPKLRKSRQSTNFDTVSSPTVTKSIENETKHTRRRARAASVAHVDSIKDNMVEIEAENVITETFMSLAPKSPILSPVTTVSPDSNIKDLKHSESLQILSKQEKKKHRKEKRKQRLKRVSSSQQLISRQQQLQNMLNKEYGDKTDWNKVYMQSNRRRARSRSLTRVNKGQQAQRYDIGASQVKQRHRSHSMSARIDYVDFVEDYALDTLLTDDASRISDDDLKQLSKNATQNNSIDMSNDHDRQSICSDFSYADLLHIDDIESNDSKSNSDDGDENDNKTNDLIDTSSEFENMYGSEPMDDNQIVENIQNRFSKLDDLFGQISATFT